MTHDCFVCFRQHSPHQILPALEFMWCLCLQMSVSTGLIPWTGCGLNICHNSICPHFIPGKMDCFPDSRPMPGLHNVGMPHLALGFSTLRAGLTYSSRWCGPQIHMWERYLSEDGNTKQQYQKYMCYKDRVGSTDRQVLRENRMNCYTRPK